MGIFAVLTKQKIIVLTLFFVLSFLILGEFYSAKAGEQPALISNSDRVDYISSLGLQVKEEPAIENVVIPPVFSDVYTAYNELQLKAGFNLEDFRGKEVVKYTYTLKSDEYTVVNLLMLDNRVIGGDICNIRLDGFMKPLIKDEE